MPNSPALLSAFTLGAALIPQTTAAQDSTPDFSGMWGRNAFNFEPMPAGPKPVDNLKRPADGAGDPNQLVGNYSGSTRQFQPRGSRIFEHLSWTPCTNGG